MKTQTFYSFIFYLMFMIFFIIPSKTIKAENKYYLHSLVYQNLTNDKSLSPVIDHWISFLYEPIDSLRIKYWDTDDRIQFKDDYCLFCTFLFQFPRDTFLNYYKIKPYILSIEKRDDIFIIKTMFWRNGFRLSDTAYNNQFPVGIIKVKVESKDNKLFLKNILFDEVKNWQKYSVKNINYFVEPSIKIDSAACKNALRFCDSLSLLWFGSEFNDTINYYVAPTIESACRLVGLDFAFMGGFAAVSLSDAGLIIVGSPSFNYLHELVHNVFGVFPNRLLNEGLATYFGGTKSLDFIAMLAEFSKKNYPLSKDKISEFYNYPGFREYYVFGELLCEQVNKLKGIEGLKSLTDTPKGSDKMINKTEGAKLLIKRICNLLGITELELIKRINDRIKSE